MSRPTENFGPLSALLALARVAHSLRVEQREYFRLRRQRHMSPAAAGLQGLQEMEDRFATSARTVVRRERSGPSVELARIGLDMLAAQQHYFRRKKEQPLMALESEFAAARAAEVRFDAAIAAALAREQQTLPGMEGGDT